MPENMVPRQEKLVLISGVKIYFLLSSKSVKLKFLALPARNTSASFHLFWCDTSLYKCEHLPSLYSGVILPSTGVNTFLPSTGVNIFLLSTGFVILPSTGVNTFLPSTVV